MIFLIPLPQTIDVAASALITLALPRLYGVPSFMTTPVLATTTAPEPCRFIVYA
jgi:hypothetical protein